MFYARGGGVFSLLFCGPAGKFDRGFSAPLRASAPATGLSYASGGRGIFYTVVLGPPANLSFLAPPFARAPATGLSYARAGVSFFLQGRESFHQ